jgi:hypothetical protein
MLLLGSSRSRAEAKSVTQHQHGFTRTSDLGLGANGGQLQERVVERVHVELLGAEGDLDADDGTQEGDVLDGTIEDVVLVFNDTATTEIYAASYALSLPDALPI